VLDILDLLMRVSTVFDGEVATVIDGIRCLVDHDGAVPVPVPSDRIGESGTGTRRSVFDEAVSVVRSCNAVGVDETSDSFPKGLVADSADAAEDIARHRGLRASQDLLDPGIDAIGGNLRECRRGRVVHNVQGEGVSVCAKLEREVLLGGSRAVLGGEEESLVLAPEVEVRVPPGMQVGRSTKRLPAADMSGSLAGMVDEEHRGGIAALKAAQEAEERSHFCGGVLIDGMEAYEGIEHQELGTQARDRGFEVSPIFGEVEAQRGCGDDVEVERVEVDAGGLADAQQTLAHRVGWVLGGVEEHGPGGDHREASQGGCAGGHRDGQVEREEGLAALGLAAGQSHRLLGPEPLDEPVVLRGPKVELMGTANGEPVHRARREEAARRGGVFAARSGAWKTSR